MRTLKVVLVVTACSAAAGCYNSKSWTEEVQLPDGRVVIVLRTATLRYEFDSVGGGGNVPIRYTLTTVNPDTGSEILWRSGYKMAPVLFRFDRGDLPAFLGPLMA